jgi:diaminopimelate decarboxylase
MNTLTAAKLAAFDTPFYYYNLDLLDNTLQQVQQQSNKHGFHVHYAMKANTDSTILKIINKYGLGADCVSGNEVKKALEEGFDKTKVVFAGVGKADKEIIYALEQDIFCFNCESIPELEVINELAAKINRKARVALRINPNVKANTHHYITTGIEENKFGINIYELDAVIERLKTLDNLELLGLHFHIGSQITDLSAFKNLCTRVNELQHWFEDKGLLLKVINVGGGLGVDYMAPDEVPMPDFESYFNIFKQFLEVKPGQQVHFELGRAIVAQCGSLISKVLYVKEGIKTSFVILDAGMNDLIRPALYQAYHKIENISNVGIDTHKYDVVGPVCESSDCFGKVVALPLTQRGHLIAIRTAGAYGQVMASDYNLRARAPSIFSTDL